MWKNNTPGENNCTSIEYTNAREKFLTKLHDTLGENSKDWME